MDIKRTEFGQTSAGQTTSLFEIQNSHGSVLKLTDYGAIIVALELADRHGKLENVTLRFDNLDGYLQRHPYFGATVGRVCNRIALGKFSLQGNSFQLATNNGANHLHGGLAGFDRYVWQSHELSDGVCFTRISVDGEEGYPGNLQVKASYRLTDDNELRIDFEATCDKVTPINLTNHCYWNLNGAGQGNMLRHELQLFADQYLPVNDGLIPTGELLPVANTPLDFTSPKAIGADIASMTGDPGGYDHCFVLRSQSGTMEMAARVCDPDSGRVMEVYTTQPGIQFYTGNFLNGTPATGGYRKHAAFCLETQHFPDSVNQPNFPTILLSPGETFRQSTAHRFSVV